MQKNNFEKQVEQKLEEFAMLPNEIVWQKVSGKIAEEKRRRRIFMLWLFTGILLVGGGSGYFMLSNDVPDKISVTEAARKTALASTRKQDVNAKLEESKAEPVEQAAEETNTEENQKVSSNKETEPSQTAKASRTFPRLNEQDQTNRLISNRIINNNSLNELKEFEKQKQAVTQQPISNTVEATKELPATVANANPEESKPQEKQNTITNPTASITTSAIKNKGGGARSFTFGFSVVGGLSNNVTSRIFPSTKSADRFMNSSPSAGSSLNPSGFNYIPGYRYSNNLSAGVGVFVQQAIGKRLNVSVGLDYQYMSASLAVGSRVDSVRTFQDSTIMKTATVAGFYRAGENMKGKSSYHFIKVPVNFIYRLNKNADKPINLSAGISGQYLVASEALYLNTRQRVYYKEDDQLKKVLVGVQSGVTFTLSSNKNYSIEAGPQFQYQTSNLTKPLVNTSEHLLFLGFKANILLKKNK